MSRKLCYKITMDNRDPLLSRPYDLYVISKSMEDACKIVNKSEDKSWQHEIKICKLLGDAL